MTLYSITKNDSYVKADTGGRVTTPLWESAEKFTTQKSAIEMATYYGKVNNCKYDVVKVSYR